MIANASTPEKRMKSCLAANVSCSFVQNCQGVHFSIVWLILLVVLDLETASIKYEG
jgi:hypothetical protein